MTRKFLEAALIVVGIGCLLGAGLSSWRYQQFQREALVSDRLFVVRSSSTIRNAGPGKSPALIGRLRVKRIGFDVAMVEGEDEGSLALGAGHIPGTATAGMKGNMIVAGHRDTAFWPLRQLKLGDRLEVSGGLRSTYEVRRLYVVKPDNQEPLQDRRDAVLTLITCYPFRHVGPAPDRFIVEARLVSSGEKKER